MLRADARTEAFRRAGLFGGAVLFASGCTQWIFSLIYHTGRVNSMSSFGPISAMFVVLGVYAAIVFHDRFVKAAAILFAVQHLLALIPNISASVIASLLSNALVGVTAVLLIVAGARRRTRKALALAVVVFVVSTTVFFGFTEYGEYVLGGRSVMRGQRSHG